MNRPNILKLIVILFRMSLSKVLSTLFLLLRLNNLQISSPRLLAECNLHISLTSWVFRICMHELERSIEVRIILANIFFVYFDNRYYSISKFLASCTGKQNIFFLYIDYPYEWRRVRNSLQKNFRSFLDRVILCISVCVCVCVCVCDTHTRKFNIPTYTLDLVWCQYVLELNFRYKCRNIKLAHTKYRLKSQLALISECCMRLFYKSLL